MTATVTSFDAAPSLSERAHRSRSAVVALSVPIAAVVAALTVGAVLIWNEGSNPFAVYYEVVRGVFVENRGLRSTAVGATPLLLMGTGLAVAYRARLFTIGAEGQYVIGAVAATAWATNGLTREWPGYVLIPTCILLAAIAGALWSSITAVLHSKFGTSIVISSLLLTYVAISVMRWAARVGIRDPDSFVAATRVIGNAKLPVLPIHVHAGFAIAVVVVPIVTVLVARTRFGYRTDVYGHNSVALGANDVRPTWMIVVVLALVGALAGTAGYIEVAGVTQRINNEFPTGLGFTAIVVAMLGRLHPIGVAVAAFGLSGLSIGFATAERAYDLPASLVTVLQALLVVFVVIGDALASRMRWAEGS